nr:hypothetical protein Iba_chr05cCG4260 [Ipomoea batatas]
MQVEEPQVPTPIAKHGAWMIVNRKYKGPERGPAKPTGKPRGDPKHSSPNHPNSTRAARNNSRSGDFVGNGRSDGGAAAQGRTASKYTVKEKHIGNTPVSNPFSYLQDLEGLHETPVLLEEETVSRRVTATTRNQRKTNRGKKQLSASQGTASGPTGLFTSGTPASDHLFVFGNPPSAHSNPSSEIPWRNSSLDLASEKNQIHHFLHTLRVRDFNNCKQRRITRIEENGDSPEIQAVSDSMCSRRKSDTEPYDQPGNPPPSPENAPHAAQPRRQRPPPPALG